MLNGLFSMTCPAQALLATLFTWSVTALGASLVFFLKKPNQNLMDAMLGMAGGVMVAASFFSLLAPSVEMAAALELTPWLVACGGFLAGGALLFLGDRFFSRIQSSLGPGQAMGEGWKRCAMLIFSITLHNIPEGMAVGVAFGSLAYGLDGGSPAGAWLLALGIGLQNFPEGMAVSLPLRREGYSRRRSFFYGQLSGVVEPIAGFLGALLVVKVRTCLPFLLAFAAGAMIYVVVEELIPETAQGRHTNLSTIGFAVGFVLMMVMDVLLG